MTQKKKLEFTDYGQIEVDRIMVTLGKKTKKLFNDALKAEFADIFSMNHQMLNTGDVIRVAKKLKL